MIDNGYQVEAGEETTPGSMGLDVTTLGILIPVLSTALVELASVFKIWLANRRVKVTLKNEQTGLSCEVDSTPGKLSPQELENLLREVVAQTENG